TPGRAATTWRRLGAVEGLDGRGQVLALRLRLLERGALLAGQALPGPGGVEHASRPADAAAAARDLRQFLRVHLLHARHISLLPRPKTGMVQAETRAPEHPTPTPVAATTGTLGVVEGLDGRGQVLALRLRLLEGR